MQEIWSMLPDLKGSESALETMQAELFNGSEKSWWYVCQAWDLILKEFDGGSLMLVNTVIGEAQEEILGFFCSRVLQMTADPIDPDHYSMEVFGGLKSLVPLILTIYGEDVYERLTQLADESQQPVLRAWAEEAQLIDWDKVDAFYEAQ